jgi:hypothetical protein
MENFGKFWVDQNGNEWAGYGEKEAEAFSETMINCTNCTNCHRCTNCHDCDDCVDCTNLDNCTNCRDESDSEDIWVLPDWSVMNR